MARAELLVGSLLFRKMKVRKRDKEDSNLISHSDTEIRFFSGR